MEKVPRNYSLADTVFLCNWSIARESLILVIYWYYWLQLDISTERGYLKKCWYRIRSLTYVRDDTIKLVTVEIYYCCSTMRFTIKTTLLPLFITQNRIGLKKRCFCHHWLGPGSRSKICLSTRFETFPLDSGSMLRLARNDNGKGMRATVCSQASKTIEPCPPVRLKRSFRNEFFENFETIYVTIKYTLQNKSN